MATVFTPGFKIATADATGAKQSYEVTLSPAPAQVNYPQEMIGELVETADGRVVIQQPTKDSRRRSWVWLNYPASVGTYERQFKWLEGLRSRVRQNSGQGAYIYVYDGTTKLLNRRRSMTIVVTSQTGTALTVPDFSATVEPVTLPNAVVEVQAGAGAASYERYTVLSSSGNTNLTIDRTPSASLNGRTIILSWTEPSWWKARIVEVSRTLDSSGNIRYSESKFTFVIEDANWTELG